MAVSWSNSFRLVDRPFLLQFEIAIDCVVSGQMVGRALTWLWPLLFIISFHLICALTFVCEPWKHSSRRRRQQQETRRARHGKKFLVFLLSSSSSSSSSSRLVVVIVLLLFSSRLGDFHGAITTEGAAAVLFLSFDVFIDYRSLQLDLGVLVIVVYYQSLTAKKKKESVTRVRTDGRGRGRVEYCCFGWAEVDRATGGDHRPPVPLALHQNNNKPSAFS